MYELVKAELLKQKYTFNNKVIWIAPILTFILAFILVGGRYFQGCSYNWWYLFILPSILTMVASYVIRNDSKKNFHGLFSIVIQKKQIWYSKIFLCAIYLGITCLIFFIGVTLGGYLFKTMITARASFFASILLIILFLWQIPLWMYLSLKINPIFSILISIVCNVGISIVFSTEPLWWIPFAIPSRIMCSVIGILPNGLNVENNSYLINGDVILPAVIITSVLFMILSYLTAKSFEKREV